MKNGKSPELTFLSGGIEINIMTGDVMAELSQKIAARCEIEKSHHNFGPSEMMENIKTVIVMI